MTEKKAIANFISQTREYSKITKYLGVDVDESLKFDVQVNNLTVKLAKLIGWLYRQTEKNITNKPILRVVYVSYVLPNFDYACTIKIMGICKC